MCGHAQKHKKYAYSIQSAWESSSVLTLILMISPGTPHWTQLLHCRP